MRRGSAKSALPSLDQLKKRMICAFLIIAVLFTVLVFRIGWIQIIDTQTYAARAMATQTRDTTLFARRGMILDRNMKELAVSTATYRIFIRVKPYSDAPYDYDENSAMLDKAAVILSGGLGTSKEEILTKFNTTAYRVSVAKNVDKDIVAKMLTDARTEKISEIFEVEDDTSRVYPLGTFASHLIGSVNSDGHGQSGIEYEYDEYLTGIAGRLVTTTDGVGNPLGNDTSRNYEKQDGLSIVTTIDETIQYFVEKAVVEAKEITDADKVECVVLEVKTGDVLAMATYPSFDPGDPYSPTDEAELELFNTLSTEEQTDYLSRMWTNPIISDLYEPGSVFKLITVSSAFETNAIVPSDHFYCGGVYKVEDRNIQCWTYPNGHGEQDVVTAVGNSCNPAMMQIIQRMGYPSFSKYMELFGMTEATGIDLPGEAVPLKKDYYYPSDLATMSFGQGISITPIEMASAVAAIGNGGNLMRPRVVRALADEDGNIVQEFPPEIRRQVISTQTADEVRSIMEYVVNEGGGQVAKIPGYRIGGKTGTTTKLINGEYSMSDRVGSMVAMAPMDDPKFVVFVAVDHPRVGEYGTTTAGPAVRTITEQILNYYNLQPAYTEEELAKQQQSRIVVPKVTEIPASEAEGILLGFELEYSVQGGSYAGDFIVTDQYPKAGSYIEPGGTVYIYGD
ncbi:MAG: stage V sporulation protein D [Clostridiales Family XIII bacterium]|jgi:stage V sporulation protein D (sporulation-specific penicillin-binding protein)|nr:stage V sporulation protein D [Clostridiales Family XIII bacterium]